MISNAPHCHYRRNPLADVICQFRFPEILSIETTFPSEFQEQIRDRFPIFRQLQEFIPEKGSALSPVAKPKSIVNYQFLSADGKWRINLTSRFISLSCSEYNCWEQFASYLDQPLAAFLQLYRPSHFERVGLRYVNFFSRKNLDLDLTPFRELFSPCYLGPLAMDQVVESTVSKSIVEFDIALHRGGRAKVHAGPGLVNRNGISDKEIKFIFDQDIYMNGPFALNMAVNSLNTLHNQAYALFRGAVTNRMHEAMQPE